MARTITGNRTPPRFTTGPATRHALAAAGALGATSGSVVHLAAAPTGDPASAGVLAHELAHTRRQVSRPRFLLASATGPVDEDEREALAVGHGRLRHGSPGTTVAPQGSVAAGIVDRLPVGAGVGPIGELSAGAGVRETTAASSSFAPSARGAVINAATADEAASGNAAGGAGLGGGGGDTASGGTGADAGGSATTPPGSTPGGSQPPPAAGGGVPLDPDRIVELVEERLLREIERRGGRWAGVF
jgi:hypothetical protein